MFNVYCVMRHFFATLSIVLSLVLAAGAQAQLSLDSTSIVIGEQATLTVERTTSYPTTDELTDESIVALRQWYDTATQQQHTVLTSFEPGEHWIHVGDDSILLTVNDVDGVDTTSDEIKDIAGLMTEPYTFWEIFRWVLLVIVVAIIVVAIYYVAKRLRNNQRIIGPAAVPPRPLDERTLAALEELRRRQLWQQGKAKDYHTELTDIVRGFIEEACGINSTEMTSDETLASLAQWRASHSDIPAETEQMLGNILHTADMVKFAKMEPLPYEHDRSMNDAIHFVQTMTSQPEKTEPDA